MNFEDFRANLGLGHKAGLRAYLAFSTLMMMMMMMMMMMCR
jgi:hypothetical protein